MDGGVIAAAAAAVVHHWGPSAAFRVDAFSHRSLSLSLFLSRFALLNRSCMHQHCRCCSSTMPMAVSLSQQRAQQLCLPVKTSSTRPDRCTLLVVVVVSAVSAEAPEKGRGIKGAASGQVVSTVTCALQRERERVSWSEGKSVLLVFASFCWQIPTLQHGSSSSVF